MIQIPYININLITLLIMGKNVHLIIQGIDAHLFPL